MFDRLSTNGGHERWRRVGLTVLVVFLVGTLAAYLVDGREITSRSGNLVLVEVRPDGAWIHDTLVIPDEHGTEDGRRHFVIEFDAERHRRGIGFGSRVWIATFERRDVWLRASDGRRYTGPAIGPVRPAYKPPDTLLSLLRPAVHRLPEAQPIDGVSEDAALALALAAAAKSVDADHMIFRLDGMAPLIAQGGGTEIISRGWGLALWTLVFMAGAACSAIAMAGVWMLDRLRT